MKPRASLYAFSWRGVPVYLHITLPIGLAVVSQLSFRPALWFGFAILILVHEAGHAVLLRQQRLPVLAIVIHGFGGECETVDFATRWQRAVVAWGGVLAQALLFFALTLIVKLGFHPTGPLADLYSTLVATNVLLAAINLLPLPLLDGGQAWRLPWLCLLRARRALLAWRLMRLEAVHAKAKRERLH